VKTVFGDAYYFLALLNDRDQHASRVRTFSDTFRARIVTTEFVLIETADALAGTGQRSVIRDYFRHIAALPVVEILNASHDLFDRGLTYYHRHADKGWSLMDCISFVVMRDLSITEALTGDHHFQQAGFEALFL
jgi:uncharacterized protein